MDIVEAVRLRKSVRGFKPDPIPRETLKEILEVACRAPSGNNVQPWEIAVLTGKTLENVRQGNVEMLKSGVIPKVEAGADRYSGIYKQRGVELSIQLFNLMGIAREDKAKRAEWMQRGLRYFDAPAVVVIYTDGSIKDSRLTWLDIGCLVQTICLVALNYGLGTCIQAQGVMYSEVIRRFTGIPESKELAVSVAVGYPDWDFPANKVQSKREPVDNIVTWYE